MKTKYTAFVVLIGKGALLFSCAFLFLFVMNLRSRIYYNAPNLGFLLWVSLYFLITGLGLIGLRKWAVLLLFVPSVLYAVILTIGISKSSVPMVALFLNVAMLVVLVAVPFRMLRNWRELNWWGPAGGPAFCDSAHH